MADEARGRRSITSGPWHYCARCDRKKLLRSEVTWQRGKLLCRTCLDRMLVGDREVKIDMVLSDGKEELAPDQKLRDPDIEITEDDILFT